MKYTIFIYITFFSFFNAIYSQNELSFENTLKNIWAKTYDINSEGTGLGNATLGYSSGVNNTEGVYNVFIGSYSGYNNTFGSVNVYLGSYSGYGNLEGKKNVFIGYKSGYYEKGSNKLYISNSATKRPLIYGDFVKTLLKVNGTLVVEDLLKLKPKKEAPEYPSEGTIYMDKKTKELKVYNGKTWKTIMFKE